MAEINSYAITIEKVPGFSKTRETFLIQSTSDMEAWTAAMETVRRYDSMAILTDVKLLTSEDTNVKAAN